MSSTVTHFTKSFSKQADITGSPEQAFNMHDSHEKYLTYVLGGITAGSIVALGSIATSGSFQYLYAPQITTILEDSQSVLSAPCLTRWASSVVSTSI
jgi:hypothetical protein